MKDGDTTMKERLKILITEQWMHGYIGTLETPIVKQFSMSEAEKAEKYYQLKKEKMEKSGGMMSLNIKIVEVKP